ncbi:hypothetical protein GCM10025876_23900 [Demequina litorisediminis]|uniref:DNA-directed RNA polymerase n=1 Tax=Demequina litorisediminis TaxID=1849022 RepID=A0ABQ6IFI6_9MICO|nr:hypothetical protein GCM10025876_23900 [Demequina litorisediminis]
MFDGLEEDTLVNLRTVINPNRDGDRLVDENGKARLFDGRTGEPFPEPVAVGYKYILKAPPPGRRQDSRPFDRPLLDDHPAAARR